MRALEQEDGNAMERLAQDGSKSIDRRRFLLSALERCTALVGLGLARAAWAEDAPKADARPNVLFIGVDGLNSWTGCLGGHPNAKTPNIDRLAARGVLFANAHCTAPVCSPSRTSLLTGLLPSTSGVYKNSQPWDLAVPDAVTLPEYFRRARFRTVGVGRIFHEERQTHRTWDHYVPYPYESAPVPPKRPLCGVEDTDGLDWGPLDVADSAMADTRVADAAIAQLGRRHSQPMFLACGFYSPHRPWFAPRRFFDQHPLESIELPPVADDDVDDLPAKIQSRVRGDIVDERIAQAGARKHAVRAYLACMSFVDWNVGRVLDALERSACRANTIVVFWSDHGHHLGQKKQWGKSTLWQESTWVPLIIAAPGRVPGRVCRHAVSLVDIYPTLIDLCDLPPRPECNGHSLESLLVDPTAPWPHAALTTKRRGSHSVCSEHWRYTRYRDGGEELYDHRTDPHEWVNLADRPDMTQVKTRLAAWFPDEDAPDGPRDDERPAWHLKAVVGAVAALGVTGVLYSALRRRRKRAQPPQPEQTDEA